MSLFVCIFINAIVIFWESFFFFRFSGIHNDTMLANYLFLTLTLCIPTLQALLNRIVRMPAALNETRIPEILLNSCFIAVNLIVTLLLSVFNRSATEITLITEGILFSVYLVAQAVLITAKRHMKKINR